MGRAHVLETDDKNGLSMAYRQRLWFEDGLQ